jgi:hypothetical protein
MARNITFSKQSVTLKDIADHHADLERALYFFFSPTSPASLTSPAYISRFFGYTPQQIRGELEGRLAELELSSIFSILSAIEAAIKIDYHLRCRRKMSDPISISFRAINKRRRGRPDFDLDILETWKTQLQNPSAKTVSDLRGAFKVRHWLAHGRYYIPNLGRKYDYVTVNSIASAVLSSLPLIGA